MAKSFDKDGSSMRVRLREAIARQEERAERSLQLPDVHQPEWCVGPP